VSGLYFGDGSWCECGSLLMHGSLSARQCLLPANSGCLCAHKASALELWLSSWRAVPQQIMGSGAVPEFDWLVIAMTTAITRCRC
jgi:hypothetical protein